MKLDVIPFVKLQKLMFFLYMCGICAHNADSLFDTLVSRGALILLFIVEVLSLFADKKLPRVHSRGYFAAFVCFVAYVFVACLWASSKTDAFNMPYWFGFAQILFVAFFLERHVQSREDAQYYIKLVVYALVYTLIVLVIKTPMETWMSFGEDIYVVRLGYDMGHNPNTIGIFCAVGAILSMFFAQKNRWYYGLVLIFLVFDVFSGSRKGLLMLLIGCAIFVVFQERGRKLVRNLLIIFVVATMLLVAVMKIEFLYNAIGNRFEMMMLSFLGLGGDASMNERAFFSNYAMNMIAQKPVFGWGTNGFVTEMRRINYSNIAYCHNNYLELMATLGVVGLVLYYSTQVRILFVGILAYVKTFRNEILLAICMIITIMLGEIYYVSFFDRFTQVIIVLMYLVLKTSVQDDVCTGLKPGSKKWI